MAPRIWTGIAAPMAAISVLLLVIAVGSAWYIRNMQESVAGALEENVTSMRAAQELELSVRDLRLQGVRYLITSDTKELEPIHRLEARVMAALERAESLANTPEEQSLMRRTRGGLRTFFGEYDKMTGGNPHRADYARTLDLWNSVLDREVIEPTREYLRLNEGALAKANEENRRTASRLTTGLIILGLCGAIGGLLAGSVISAALRRSLLRTEERLRTTARQLDEAARTTESTAHRAELSVDALDDVAKSATAVLDRLKATERDALRAEQLAWAGQMAAGIAHEIRNPLMAIKLLVQALAAGRTADRLRPRDMQVLEDEIGRLEQIISSFLDFARPARPDKKPVEIGPLVELVAARVRSRAESQGVAIELNLPPRPLVADLDPNQLQQVLYNLLFNALDAQPNGGRIVIAVRPDDDGLTLIVDDAGAGLPAVVRDKLFEPFVSTKEQGMGLGLSICRRIIESHGGEIRAENRPPGGARFLVRLPAQHGGTSFDNEPLPPRVADGEAAARR